MTAEIVALQASPDAPQSQGVTSGTNMLLPPNRVASRFDHFSEEVYDLSAESHLARFLKVLLGDAGAGQTRKRMLVARMQQTLQGTHFYDLDRFYGALFGVRRSPSEILELDPYSQTATSETWSRQHAKDASYRSRVQQFARALSHGATPTGMELVAEALLAADCEVYEAYIQADAGFRTYAELEAEYPTYGDLEGVSYGVLEGQGQSRMAGNERREFVVRPKRRITQGEAYDLSKVLSRLKPADARFTIDTTGIEAYDEVPIRTAQADSNFWEILPRVAPRTGLINSPYTAQGAEPVEQPRPPFSGYQGEAWSYIGDIIGVSAYQGAAPMPTQRVVLPDGGWIDYDAHSGLLPRRQILAGRSVSDGVLVSHPYWSQSSATSPDLAPLFTDRIPVDALTTLLRENPLIDALPTSPAERFWATPARRADDPTPEILEIRLTAERQINHLSMDVAHYPHDLAVEIYDETAGEWVTLAERSVGDSVPQYLAPGRPVLGHPQHSHPGHWISLDFKFEPVTTSRLRVTLTRNGGLPPRLDASTEAAYSLALRSMEPGYRVYGLDDVPADRQDGVIGSTTDAVGSTVEFSLSQARAEFALAGSARSWKSEPQPVNYAVVNFYLDVRSPAPANDAQIIERFFLDPTHAGAHMTIYWSAAVVDDDALDTAQYEALTWTPIPRDYILQKGYVHIPPTRARFFKFEFTSLTPEPFESFLPIVRKVRLFPRRLIQEIGTGMSDEAYPPGLQSEMAIASTDIRYGDALDRLAQDAQVSRDYTATEALFAVSPAVQQQAAARSWVYGFQPWHQGGPAPRWLRTERHVYETFEIKHTTKVGFFVGLNEVSAFSVQPSADDDTAVYLETFHDFRQIEPGMTWTFDPNVLSSGLASDVVATSRVYQSRHNVRALQFATQQTDPEQLVPDDDFRDPALAASDFTNDESWHKVGDAILVYSPSDHSLLMVRYAEPLLRPPTPETRTLTQGVVNEVFSFREAPFVDSGSSAAQSGGMESTLLGASDRGRGYAAVRMTFLNSVPQDAPLMLQVVRGSDREVLTEMPISGNAGETVERVMPHDLALSGADPIRVRLMQSGVSDTQVKVDALSFFDEGILWEFSVNGGSTWVQAIGVRNNANGILTFPEPGNQLVWRATGLRQRMAITALKMRPQYIGLHNARDLGVQRGPNVSTYDADVPIQDDPMFTDWTKPVPRHWYAAYKRFPKLPVEGAPNVTEFARFYGRPVADGPGTPVDSAQPKRLIKRSGVEWPGGLPIALRFQQPIEKGLVAPLPRLVGSWLDPAFYPTPPDTASTAGSRYYRKPVDTTPGTTDGASWFKIGPDPASPMNRVIHPV